jgi:hypothetical protein
MNSSEAGLAEQLISEKFFDYFTAQEISPAFFREYPRPDVHGPSALFFSVRPGSLWSRIFFTNYPEFFSGKFSGRFFIRVSLNFF